VDAEVVIVGAGAAGGVLAFELARRGVRVIVLESGPRHEFVRRAEYARRYVSGEDPWQTAPRELDRYTVEGTVPYGLAGRRARGIGGSTLHWEGYALRLHASDFRLRSLHGLADDWPLSYQDLERYYGAAEKALGVAGAPDEPWASPRSLPFPLPPFPFSYSDRLFASVGGNLGLSLHHLAQARNSVAYAGRSQCRACSTCAICPTGAKASIDLTHVPGAEATGNARIVTEATVSKLELGRSGDVVAAVYATRDKQERRVTGRVFILAAGAVENVRLLLLSSSPQFQRGLANRSGLVGRSFMSHPFVDVVGRSRDKVYPYRIGFSTAMSRQFATGGDRSHRAGFLLEFLNSAGPTPREIALGSKKWGEVLRQHVCQEFGHWLGIRVYCEQLPDPANAVSLAPRVRDYFGSPAPHIRYDIGPYERRGLDEGTNLARRILTALGATGIRATDVSYAAHQIGTHRMGLDASRSVVDRDLRCHDVPNLYLMGSGCFVTASASPPTLTITALAIRAAEHIAARFRKASEPESP
jgi:choline dehydrogenase-like flavoprotein